MQLPQVWEVECFGGALAAPAPPRPARQWVAAATRALPPSVCASGADSLKTPTDLHGTTSL